MHLLCGVGQYNFCAWTYCTYVRADDREDVVFYVGLVFRCSRRSFLDTPTIFSCQADHVVLLSNWEPRRLFTVWSSFRDAQGFGRLDAGSRAGSTNSRPTPLPWISVFQFPYFSTMCGLEKLGFVDQNDWSERNLSSLLLRTLVVGRRQQSESIEVALDNME